VIVTGLWLALGLAAAVVGFGAVELLGAGDAVALQALRSVAIVAMDAINVDRRLVRVNIGGPPLMTVPRIGD
jgi:hypothetical protein